MLRNFFKQLDYVQLLAVCLLLGCGLIFIRSTGIQVDTELSRSFFPRQICWIMLGMVAYWFFAVLDYRTIGFKFGTLVFYLFSLVLLVYVLFFGRKVFGATRWINFFGFRLQPSEPAKLAVIAMLAWLYAARGVQQRLVQTWLISIGVTTVPFLLIVIEPDLGSALILLPIYLVMIFCAGLKWRYILAIVLLAAAAAAVLCTDYLREDPLLLREYQRDRIRTFLNPGSDKSNLGHNAYQAKLAVGSGGFAGKGIGEGTQNELGFLPQTVSNNDFIFSVIAEETGFSGVLLLLGMYILLLYSMLRTAFLAPEYGRMLAVGSAALIFCHVFINIGMSVGLAPVTGLPLPLVSYGGSFIISMMSVLGVMQSIYRHREMAA